MVFRGRTLSHQTTPSKTHGGPVSLNKPFRCESLRYPCTSSYLEAQKTPNGIATRRSAESYPASLPQTPSNPCLFRHVLFSKCSSARQMAMSPRLRLRDPTDENRQRRMMPLRPRTGQARAVLVQSDATRVLPVRPCFETPHRGGVGAINHPSGRSVPIAINGV
jgi:hypothetical protein